MSRNRSQRRRGVAATEFAVCLPVLMLLLLGAIECCSMIFLKQTLAVAAYEAAHTALAPEATAADARATGQAILADRNITGGSIDFPMGDPANTAEGQYFEVRATAAADANGVLPLSFFSGRQLSASAVFMKEI